MRNRAARVVVAFGLALAATLGIAPLSNAASENLRSPSQFFGYNLGDDDRIPRWQQVVDYYRHLSVATDRVRFEQVGLSWQKRPMILATVSSPANLARLEEIREIQLKLADPRTIRKGELPSLLRRGRAVMLFFVAEAEHTAAWLGQIQFLHQLASSDSEEVRRWLDNTVLLFMSTMNPDGLDFVYDWVEKTRGTQWQGGAPPELSSLLGEINRDWYTFAMPESRAVVNVMKRWQPNAIHDIHTMGSQPRTWVRLFVPPFTGPVEPNIHPLIWHLQNEMGMAMAGRVIERKLPGLTFGAQYDLWNPARGYAQHHHTLRILSESSPPRLTTPTTIRFEDLTVESGVDPRKPSVRFPLVWYGGEWGNKQILPYITTVLEAEANHLADNRERYLRAKHAAATDTIATKEGAYLVPPDQHDPSVMREMLEMLSFGEIEIYRAHGPLRADGVDYPAGTYSIPLNQPFGNWAKAMLEAQAYPEVRACAQCPIDAPYDTVAFSYPYAMGVKVVAAKSVAGPIAREIKFPPQGGSVMPSGKPWYLLATNENTVFKVVARLLRENAGVSRALTPFDAEGKQWAAGTFVIQSTPNIEKQLGALALEFGLQFVGQDHKPPEPAMALRLPRVAVYRPHVGGRTGYGHARLLFPEYGIPFEFVVDADLRKGNLRERFDSLILPSYISPQEFMQGRAVGSSPPELTGGIGTAGVENLTRFVESGGTLIALDRANDFVINQLKLPVANTSGATVRMFGRPGSTDAAADKPGPQLTIPGSFLRIAADMKHPIAFGMPGEFSGMFNRGQVLESRGPDSISVADYPEGTLLLSGMALGAEQLRGKSAVMDVKRGAGRVVLFGIRPELRLQTRGTYKLLLNAIYLSAAELR